MDALSLPIVPTQTSQLLDLLALLQRWNSTYNLTAVRDVDAMLVQHLADCLSVIQPLGRLPQPVASLLDVGSGAGFPGLVIAVMCPLMRVTCVDSVGKKAAFIRQAATELGLTNLASEHARVQTMGAIRFDVITSRAFSDLALFTQLTSHLLAISGCWMAMKGKVPHAETDALAPLGIEFHVEQLRVPMLQADRCLVWMSPSK